MNPIISVQASFFIINNWQLQNQKENLNPSYANKRESNLSIYTCKTPS